MTTDLANALLIYALTAVCLYHAWKQGNGWIATFIGALIFGFVPEYLSVRTQAPYCYDRFIIMLPPGSCAIPQQGVCPCPHSVPLMVLLGWGFLIYCAMATSSRLPLPWQIRPIFDAFLVVNVDWVLDPLAQQQHWWTWDLHEATWFGIPLDNYFGWVMIVGTYSFLLRWLRRTDFMRSRPRLRDWGAPLLVGLIGPWIAIPIIKLYTVLHLDLGVSQWPMLGLVFAAMVAFLLHHYRRVDGDLKPDWLLMGMAWFHHVTYMVVPFLTGLYVESPELMAAAAITTVISFFCYSWPYRLLGNPADV